MTMLTIWGRANSINVQKVLFCCEELGLPYRRIDAGGEFGVTNSARFIAMNPNRLVPTIEDGEFQLWESNVIVRYLAQKYGFGTLCPERVERRFDAERWIDWQATSLWPVLRIIFIGLIRTAPEQRDAGAIARAEEQCARFMAMLDAQLGVSPFVGGDRFTMGDIPVAVSTYRWYTLEIAHPKLPNLERWYESLTQRSSFRDVVMLPLS